MALKDEKILFCIYLFFATVNITDITKIKVHDFV